MSVCPEQITVQLGRLVTQRQHSEMYRERRCYSDALFRLNFCSNDYLALSDHEDVKKAYQEGFEGYPSGSGGSIVVTGYHSVHRDLEQWFSRMLGCDDALLFSSGYGANLAIISLFAEIGVPLIIDKAVHASIYDGITYSGIDFIRYRHQCVDDLKEKIVSGSALVTETVFSMSGEKAALAELSQLCTSHDSTMLVDEAHSFGLYGPSGMGGVLEQGLTQDEVPLRVIPFGKAIASSGAVVVGQAKWIDALLQVARPAIYSTAISPAHAYGVLKTLDVIQRVDDRRKALAACVNYFRDCINDSPLTWRDSVSAIQQLQLGCPRQALLLSNQLRDRGIHCIAIRQPTVTKSETGLRITLNYRHQPEDIDYLLRCIHDAT